jgi:trimeric autotransporter adhesin
MNFKSVIRLFLFATCTASSTFLPAQTTGPAPAPSPAPRRVVAAVDASDRVPLASVSRPWTRKATDMGTVSGQTAAPHMLLLLQRSTQQQQALNEYVSDLQNPSSPSYHHWLTPAQFAASYGVNAEDVASVTTWLQSSGFTIDKVSAARNVIEFSGTVSQLEQTFKTQVHRLALGTRSEDTAVSSVQVPRALSPVIHGLVNLDSAHAHRLFQPGASAKYDPASHTFKPQFTVFDDGTPLLFVDPSDAATIYDTPNANLNPNFHGTTLDGTGVNVGIVGDSNVDMTPVANYRQAFLGETAGNQNLPTVIVDGTDPGETGDVVESWLDMEILGGIAPNAKLYYYASADSDLTAGVQNAILRAVNDNVVSILSISFGGCEADQGTSGNAFFSEEYEQAAAQGITVTVSSGDSGSAGCDADNLTAASQGLAVNGLGSTPYNISVGGTDFDVLATDFETYVDDSTSGNPPYYRTVQQYIPEEPWNDSTQVNGALADNETQASQPNIIGGGGGVSSIYSKPAFQTALTPQDGARDLPDVSFLAANGLYGVSWAYCEIADGGTDCATANGALTATSTVHGAGGTSASTPAFAGMLALLEQSTGSRLGQANNVLYQLAAANASTVLHDVTAGNNSVVCSTGSSDCGGNGFLSGWDAGTGYDNASGLGSVDAAQMVSNWNSIALAPTTTTLDINGSTNAITVAHGTSLNLQVAVDPTSATGDASLVATGASVNGLTTIPLTNGAGSSSYNGLPGGQYTVYARYGGDASKASSSSAPISVNIGKEDSSIALSANGYDPFTGAPLSTSGSIPYGSVVLIDAIVYGTAEGLVATQGVANGNITFTDNGAALATAAITSAGSASYPTLETFVPITGGAHKIVATFPGDNSYNASSSTAVNFSVTKATEAITIVPTTTTISNVGYDLITVELPAAGAGQFESGVVTLQANGVTLGSGTLVPTATSTGKTYAGANINVAGSQLQPGVNTITATYAGDVNYNAATTTFPLTLSQATFSLSTSAINLTAGSDGTAVVRATPLSQFTGVVNLSCTVTSAPANAVSPVTCSIPATINLSGLNSVTTMLAAQTSSTTTSGNYVITVTGTDAATGKITASTTSAVAVTGTVVTPAIAVSNSGPITVSAGAATGNTSTLTVTPSGAFTGAVSLACAVTSSPAGANDPVTCALSNSSLTVSGTDAVTATLTVNSTATTTTALVRGLGAGSSLLALTLLFIPARRRRLLSLACAFALIAMLGVVSGCGGGSSTSGGGGGTTPPKTVPGTTAGAYVITVTATASGVTPATATVNITVN